MTERSIKLLNDDYVPLNCPKCGNTGEQSFNAAVPVLVGGDGIPYEVGSYLRALPPVIECHQCDYRAPHAEFALRRPRPSTGRRPDDAGGG